MYLKKKIILAAVLLLAFTAPLSAQKLVVRFLDSAGTEINKQSFEIGDVVIIAHQKGKNVHYFQGKITGLFKDRNVVRVFDFARSTRALPVAGKKIGVNEIVGIKGMEKDNFKKRETGAVVASVASSIGSGIGGKAGNAIEWGSSAASVGIDLSSREQISKQRIKVEIEDF